MRHCAADVARIFTRIAPLVRALDDGALHDLGFIPSTCAIARTLSPLAELTLARVDMIPCDGGFRAIENNADTPGLFVEAHVVARALCERHGFGDPNAEATGRLAPALHRALRESARSLARAAPRPYAAFTGVANVPEDLGTMAFVRELVSDDAGLDTAFVALGDLGIDARGLYDGAGRRIDVLVRYWPIEFFARDRDEATGTNVGEMLFDLVRRREVAIVNPPSGYLLQSKGIFALVWALYERGEYFTSEEREAIARSFTPTWFEPPAAKPYVVKPMFGREGSTIRIVRDDGIEASRDRFFDGDPVVYQPELELPQFDVETERGSERLGGVYSCFIVENEPGAIALRLGERIIDADARFIALGYPRAGHA